MPAQRPCSPHIAPLGGIDSLTTLAHTVKAVFCDLDDTLLDAHHRLPSEAIDAIRHVQASGVRFIPTTGRPVFALKALFGPMLDNLGLDYIACNGMDVRQAGQTLLHETVGLESARTLLQRVIDDPMPLGFVVYGPEAPYVMDMEADFVRNKIESLHEARVRPATAGLEDAQISKLGIVAYSGARKLAQDLSSELSEHFEFSACGDKWVDVALRGRTKLGGINMLLNAYGMQPTEVLAIGDSMNDLSMLKAIPNSVCVANAMPEVKQYCRFEIGANTELAVPRLLEQISQIRAE